MAGMPAMVVFLLQKRPLLGSLLMRDQSTRARFLPFDTKGCVKAQNQYKRFCDPEGKFSQPVHCFFQVNVCHCLFRGRLSKSGRNLWTAASATNLFILCCDLGLGVGARPHYHEVAWTYNVCTLASKRRL